MARLPRQSYYRKGLWAERLSALWLRLQGYRILKSRYQNPFGEIDLIAVRRKKLVFVEVKSRARMQDAREAVTRHQQQRLQRGASYFLSKNPRYITYLQSFHIILWSGWRFQHLKDVWFHA